MSVNRGGRGRGWLNLPKSQDTPRPEGLQSALQLQNALPEIPIPLSQHPDFIPYKALIDTISLLQDSDRSGTGKERKHKYSEIEKLLQEYKMEGNFK